MIPLFSTSQIREADAFAIKELGMPGILLMENASIEIFKIISKHTHKEKKIGIVCGKGNNGGDGFASARHFANNGYSIIVIYTGKPADMSPDCKTNFEILHKISKKNKNITLLEFKSKESLSGLKKCDVIIDALLGSGAAGELKPPINEIVGFINKLKCYKVSVDIPTGLDADKGYAVSGFKPHLTITLGELKKGLFFGSGYELSGKIEKGYIGLDPSFFNKFPVTEYLIEPEDAFNYLPAKKASINKYSSGKVLTIAGSGKYPGAAAMTSRAVLKAGAGASILAFPESAKKLLHKELTEVVVESYNDKGKEILSDENVPELNKRIKWADVVALGPGLGRSESTQEAILRIIKERNFHNLVIDADGLFPLNEKYNEYNLKNIVLTPHLGEFSSLTGIPVDELKKDLLKYGKNFVKQTEAILVLKGAPTIIFMSGEVFINTTGNPGMAKFGTGDVLTGIIAGFISQQKSLLNSLICSVYIHSLTADLLMSELTEYGFTAEDIIDYFPKGIKFLKDSFDLKS